ncbi:MAG: type III-A CRISPR-associated protein Csm2 [Nitrospirae bacterium]|nr:type III-A CRISPR-associated protein Csm2 [Nitrospirota bacterium]
MSDWKDKLRNSGFNKGGGKEMKKICESCKKEFLPKEPHHKTCSDCNKKKYEGTSGLYNSKIKLPDNYLGDSYFDDKGYLRESIFKEDAKVVVNALAAENMTPTALRAFYNKLKAIENRYKISNNDFDLIKPSLYAFERDVAYQASRGVVRDEFRKFININAELAIKGPKEFKGFIEHFLSVLAYFKDVINR